MEAQITGKAIVALMEGFASDSIGNEAFQVQPKGFVLAPVYFMGSGVKRIRFGPSLFPLHGLILII